MFLKVITAYSFLNTVIYTNIIKLQNPKIMSVSANFNVFCNHLKFTSQKESIISNRFRNICKQLNKEYWQMEAEYGGMYIGSKGRQTVICNGQDIDMIFEMPEHILSKYTNSEYNSQLVFLEEVKEIIVGLYWNTEIDEEKQTIKVLFSDKMTFHILPVFRNIDGSYTKANITDNGSWCIIDPVSEIKDMDLGDHRINLNLRRLCQMARAWKKRCSVPIHNKLLDTFAREFMIVWKDNKTSYTHFDMMCRDFFKYMMDQDAAQTEWKVLGKNDVLYNTNHFRYNAIIAYDKATEAIQLETEGKHWTARQKWREVFGIKFPEDIVEELKLKKIEEKAVSIYEVQQKCVSTLNRRKNKSKTLQFTLALSIVLGILAIGYTNHFNFGIVLFSTASILFTVNVFMQKRNLTEVIKKHYSAAQYALEIKEECKLVLHDLNYNTVEMAIIQERIEKVWHKINATYMGDHSVLNHKYTSIKNRLREILHLTEKGKMLPLNSLTIDRNYNKALQVSA